MNRWGQEQHRFLYSFDNAHSRCFNDILLKSKYERFDVFPTLSGSHIGRPDMGKATESNFRGGGTCYRSLSGFVRYFYTYSKDSARLVADLGEQWYLRCLLDTCLILLGVRSNCLEKKKSGWQSRISFWIKIESGVCVILSFFSPPVLTHLRM